LGDHYGSLSVTSISEPSLNGATDCEDRFEITNTFVWPSSEQLITADTTKNALFRYRVDPATGLLSDRRTLVEGYGRGLLDGSCLDAEGMVWNARVVGGACLMWMTAEGEVVDVAELRCSWPTSCAFAGPDLSTLFVTSARFTMMVDHLAMYPQEGGLFAVSPGVRGAPPNRFGQPVSADID